MNDFGHLLDVAERLLDTAAGHADAVVADTRHWARVIGPATGLTGPLVAAVERAAADAYAQARPMFDRPGDPLALWQVANRWRDAVAAPARSAAAGLARSNRHWQGPAAEAYLATAGPQQEALHRLETAATGTAAALREAGAALVAYWTALGSALSALAGNLGLAAAAAADPATAAAGAAAALAALEQFLTVSAGLMRAMTLEADRLRGAQQATLAQLAERGC
ncbi:hypothetical protein [Dactylosporangium sp. NPDC049140]|uniref:hypothetical protein n=1 Tax=Dactylosporangium sp. NPDC049140 TaxID=3155647 RepID=UPI0033CADD4D